MLLDTATRSPTLSSFTSGPTSSTETTNKQCNKGLAARGSLRLHEEEGFEVHPGVTCHASRCQADGYVRRSNSRHLVRLTALVWWQKLGSRRFILCAASRSFLIVHNIQKSSDVTRQFQDILTDPQGFMSQDIPLLHARNLTQVQMQVRATQTSCSDPENHVLSRGCAYNEQLQEH